MGFFKDIEETTEEELAKILEGVPEAKKKNLEKPMEGAELEAYNEMTKNYQVTKEQAHQKFIQPTPPGSFRYFF